VKYDSRFSVLLIFNFHQNIMSPSAVVKYFYNVCVKNRKRFHVEKKYHVQYYSYTILCWNKTRIYKMHSQTGSVQRKKHNRSVYWKFARKFYWQGYLRNYVEEDNHECKYEACWNIKFWCLFAFMNVIRFSDCNNCVSLYRVTQNCSRITHRLYETYFTN